jgi:hypothetical protein
MSRARKISSDLRHVATLAGTTAAVVEGAAIAAEKAKSVAEHIGPERDVDSAPAVDVVEVVKGKRGKKLLVLLLLAVLAAVGIAVWKKRSAPSDEDVADLRDESRFAGSMP